MGLFSKKQPETSRRRQSDALNESLDERYTFRRNQTLTGSLSPNVVTANDMSAQIRSPRAHVHELARRRQHVGLIFLMISLVCIVLGVLILQFTASVHVRSSELTTQLDGRYVRDIEDYLNRQPVERLRFLLREDHLLAYLQSVAPEVASLEVDGATGYGTTGFVVTMRQPIVAWNINGKRQYVDTTGTAFTRNYFDDPAVQVVDESGIQIAGGETVASNRFLGFIGRVVGLSRQANYAVTDVILPRGMTREVDIRLDGVGYPVRFSVDRPAGEQVEDMDRAMTWLNVQDKKPEYLDIRVSRRAFYK
jgi:hypothetical protein